MTRIQIFAATALVLLTRSPDVIADEPRTTPARLTRFAEVIERLRDELKIPGLSVAVLEDEALVWSQGFGLADRERAIPATADTPYQLASVTKALAAVATLRLEERGLLRLEERVEDFYPAFPFDRLGIAQRRTVQLLHLITHTSDEPPGSRYRYDGDLYCGLDHAIQHACGLSFGEIFEREIAAPLGMTHTVPNPIDLDLMDRFLAWLGARGEDPTLRDERGGAHATASLRHLLERAAEQSYMLLESLLPGAMAAAGGDSTLFTNRFPRSIDERTRTLFNGFLREENPHLAIYAKLARPYTLNEEGEIVRGRYRNFFSAGAGMISSVRDLATFDIALDRGGLLKPETLASAWEPFQLASGEPSIYGLGWFVEDYGGVRLIWHGGEWDCIGALYLKVPAERLTLIALANSRALSGAFDMGAESVLNSGLGAEFLRIFVCEPRAGITGPDVNWRSVPGTLADRVADIGDADLRGLWWRQLRNMETMFRRMGAPEIEARLIREIHAPFFERLIGLPTAEHSTLTEIVEVSSAEHQTADFSLSRDQNVRIHAIGEFTEDGRWDWGWIEAQGTGEIVWEMTIENTLPAGGAGKNRRADLVLPLPAGDYRVHYETDDSHAYMTWNGPVPDHLFWGIQVLTP